MTTSTHERREEPEGPAASLRREGPLLALLLVVLGLVLRIRGLSEYWLNADEGIYYSTLTRSSFREFWAEVMFNAHPPAFYLLLRGMGALTWDFVWLRGVSVAFGAAAIWMFWLVGRELGGRGLQGTVSGLAAAAILALSGEAIVLSQVIRPYTLVVFLLAAALFMLLRYRSGKDSRYLAGYAAALSVAALCHYSAGLAWGVFSVLIASDLVTGRVRGPAAVRLLGAHAVPALLLAGFYLTHASSALESDLMRQALDPGGWLSSWLVDTPAEAWRSLVTFHNFHAPPSFRVRALAVLAAAVAISLIGGRRVVALLVAAALGTALAASALGLYPFGPTRHNAWLTVFTIPALGWLAGRVATAPPRRALLGAGALLVWAGAGIPLERILGGPEGRAVAVRTNATEERVIRRADLAPLVVARLDPDGAPRVIVMTEQTYNVLMPFFAEARGDVVPSPDSTLLHFSYGTREVVVVRSWDWSGAAQVARVLTELHHALPRVSDDLGPNVLVLAGGWGSSLLPQVPELDRRGVIVEQSVARGLDAAGRVRVRMVALVVDRRALAAAVSPPGA